MKSYFENLEIYQLGELISELFTPKLNAYIAKLKNKY